MIPALVLTAGLATRLRPLSRVRAKAALPIAGEPLVRRIIRSLQASGVRDLVLNLHHLPHTITRVVGDGTDLGVRVRYSWENPVLGSAGGPRRALPLLDAPEFFIVNGDTLTDVDLERVLLAHQASGALVTMAVVANTEPHKYGGVTVDHSRAVTGFTRKGAPEPSYHFIGVQVASAAVFAGLPSDTPYESVGGLYKTLVDERPGAVRAFICDAQFLDIGTPADYLRTCLRLATREGHALSNDSVLWDGVTVDPHARLSRCIITDGVRVPAGRWSEAIIRRATPDLDSMERRVGELAVSRIRF